MPPHKSGPFPRLVIWYYRASKKEDFEYEDIEVHGGINRVRDSDGLLPGVSNPQAFNRFAYVLGNPILRNDPSGNFSLKKFLGSNAGRATIGILSAVANAYAPGSGAAISGAATLYMNKDNLNRGTVGDMLISSGNVQAGIAGTILKGGNSSAHAQDMKMNFIYGGISMASQGIGAGGAGLGAPVAGSIAAGAFSGAANSVAANNGSFRGAGREALWGGGMAAASAGISAGIKELRSPDGKFNIDDYRNKEYEHEDIYLANSSDSPYDSLETIGTTKGNLEPYITALEVIAGKSVSFASSFVGGIFDPFSPTLYSPTPGTKIPQGTWTDYDVQKTNQDFLSGKYRVK